MTKSERQLAMTGKNGKSEIAAIPQPKRLNVGQTDDGLIEIEIQLRKYHLWVTEANSFTRFKLSALLRDELRMDEHAEFSANISIMTDAQIFGLPEWEKVPDPKPTKRDGIVQAVLKVFSDAHPESSEELYQKLLLREVWAPLFVCSRGEVPNRTQFIGIPRIDMTFWITTARELGHSFEWLDGLDKIYTTILDGLGQKEADKEDVKKKSRKPEDNPEAQEVTAG